MADMEKKDQLRVSTQRSETFGSSTELSCVFCGYNLCAQPYGGACPECGGMVRDSVTASHLLHCSRQWLQRICNSLIWLSVLVGLMVLLQIGVWLRIVVYSPELIFVYVSIKFAWCLLLWRISIPDDKQAISLRGHRWRWAVRAAALIELALLIFLQSSWLISDEVSRSIFSRSLMLIVPYLSICAQAAVFVLLLGYLRAAVVRRLQAPRLESLLTISIILKLLITSMYVAISFGEQLYYGWAFAHGHSQLSHLPNWFELISGFRFLLDVANSMLLGLLLVCLIGVRVGMAKSARLLPRGPRPTPATLMPPGNAHG